MRKIGLLSDTHSYLDDPMKKFLASVDEIWHAGDVGNLAVIEGLKDIAPLRVVFGNIDNNQLRQEFNKIEHFKVEDIPVLMTHIGGYPQKYAPGISQAIKSNGVKLFVSGHSHILKVIFDKKLDCLHINPGAAGIYGQHSVRTMVRFSISESKIHDLEVWEQSR